MRRMMVPWLAAATLVALGAGCGRAPQSEKAQDAPTAGTGDILDRSPRGHWRALDPENTLYLELGSGRVVIALAPDYAPNIVANIKALVRENYFDDGAAIVRAQDNYVVQWARPEEDARPLYTAKERLPPEFVRPISESLEFTRLPDADTYAAQVGFSGGFPVGRSPAEGVAWLAHCYAMVGAGRDVDVDTGAGKELYAVIGNAPRHLDRNVSLVGRVVHGVELLSTLRRGTGQLGFYETAAERTPIARMRVAADLPEAERTKLEVLRTDSETFAALVESRRNRTDEWFKYQAGAIELCNVPLPVRPAR